MGRIEYKKGDKVGENGCEYIREAPKTGVNRRAIFKCKCTKEFESVIGNIKTGAIKSCGCARKPNTLSHGHSRRGKTSPEYVVWNGMKDRCYNHNCMNYHYYGGRGIRVCDRWLSSFENFYKDMGARPSNKHSLDRIDNDGDYCPENCRWATMEEQVRNRSITKTIEYNGVRKPVVKWAEDIGMKYGTLRSRLRRGWDIEKSLTEPLTYQRV